MNYVQVIDGEPIPVDPFGCVEWDSTHYCPASKLTPDEASYFNVFPLYATDPPTYDPLTQICIRDGCELVGDQWQYKWRVDDLPAEQVAINQANAYTAKLAAFDAALTAHLDATAQSRRYDNRITCAVRAGYTGPFQAEGQAFAAWMDTCNAQAYQLLAEVQAGTRPLPDTTQALIDVLPAMVWPS